MDTQKVRSYKIHNSRQVSNFEHPAHVVRPLVGPEFQPFGEPGSRVPIRLEGWTPDPDGAFLRLSVSLRLSLSPNPNAGVLKT